jgi:hypothetical protein
VDGWETFAIATGPAAVTAFVAWFAARYQRQAALTETREATERIRIELAEEDRQRLLTTYHDYLKNLRRLDVLMMGSTTAEKVAFDAWVEEYYALQAAIELRGHPEVFVAVNDLHSPLEEMDRTAVDDVHPHTQAFQTAYKARRDEVISLRDKVIDAVRLVAAPRIADNPSEAERTRPSAGPPS